MPGFDWRWCAEIDPFASAVLAHRFPHVPNLGDVTKLNPMDLEPVDVLVFGSPCQSFSVAGRRLGLDDPRGNLALVALGIVAAVRPRWFVFENVPGLLSSGQRRDFGAFLRQVEDIGYSGCWRVLDAQHFGVPQRRRRIFFVGHLGDWRPAAAVLFERESLRGDSPPRREAGEDVTAGTGSGAAGRGGGGGSGLIASNAEGSTGLPFLTSSNIGKTVNNQTPLLAHSLRGEGFDASERGSETGRGTPLAFDTTQVTSKANYSNPKPGDPCHPLAAGAHAPAIAFDMRGRDASERGTGRGTPLVPVSFTGGATDLLTETDIAHPVTGRHGDPGMISRGADVRRLTPRECERLQGFPDDWTLVTYRGKPAADGPRYKALGNSMAVPVMEYILSRLNIVDVLA